MDQTTFDDANGTGHDSTFDSINTSQDGPWDSWWMSACMSLGGPNPDEGTTYALPRYDGYLPAGNTNSYETNPAYYSPWPSPVTDDTSPASTYGLEVSSTPVNEVLSPIAPKPSPKHRQDQQPCKPPSHQHAKRNSAQNTTPNTKSRSRRGSRANGTHRQSLKPDDQKTIETFDLDEEDEDRSKRVQMRNRIASNKFRVKKRADAIRLTSDEKDMQRINRELSNCVADLTQDVYNLKMQLLQHTDCNCTMIQKYISSEAHRYVQTLHGDPETEDCQP